MHRQKGQSLVEFALLVPLFFAMCFGMIYGGIMFLDYLQYNNASRSIARMISMTTSSDDRKELATDFENNTSEHVKQLTHLYTATPTVSINPEVGNVTVIIDLELTDEKSLPQVLNWLNFPPKKLNSIKIVMPLERAKE